MKTFRNLLIATAALIPSVPIAAFAQPSVAPLSITQGSGTPLCAFKVDGTNYASCQVKYTWTGSTWVQEPTDTSGRPAISSPDCAFATVGCQADTAWSSGNGTMVAMLKAIATSANNTNAQPIYCSASGSATSSPCPVANQATTNNGASNSSHLVTAATTNAALLGSAGAHNVYAYYVTNPTTSLACVHLYDNATIPTVGTTLVKHTFPVGAAGTAGVGGAGLAFSIPVGESYVNGIAISVTGGASNVCTDADTSTGPAGVDVELIYK